MGKNRKDNVYYFLEEYFIKISLSITVFTLLVFKALTYTDLANKYEFIKKIDLYIINDLSLAFINRDSTLITIAAVFIGMYFTVFTLLATISGQSSFLILNRKQLDSLKNYTRNAFVAAFTYLIISLISPILNNFIWLYSITCLIILAYMLMSALRFVLLIYLILKNDMDTILDKSREIEIKEKKKERILFELEKYLNRQSNLDGKEKADEISQLLLKRKEK